MVIVRSFDVKATLKHEFYIFITDRFSLFLSSSCVSPSKTNGFWSVKLTQLTDEVQQVSLVPFTVLFDHPVFKFSSLPVITITEAESFKKTQTKLTNPNLSHPKLRVIHN